MNENLKKNFSTFVQGFLFGLGFCMSAWALFFIFQVRTHESHQYRDDTSTVISSSAKKEPFTFRNVEEIKRNGRSYFIGSVKNNSASPARGVSVEVNLFLKNRFVDQYSSYITGDIKPGEEKYFKVSCGCKDETPAEHDSYKINIIGGF